MARGARAIGVLGGTFDPVHNAHLAMARAALEHLALERVLFIPTGPTRYRRPAIASGADRVAMLRLALAGEPRFAIDERELAEHASGFTVDTLRALHAELGEVDLHLLIGADQYDKLETWHRPDEVRRLARVGVFGRPGVDIKGEVKLIPMDPMPISASEVRARARNGEDLAGLVPPAVANYIARRGLYC
jgi:nicotinate-nucleotide adenylyltransferase